MRKKINFITAIAGLLLMLLFTPVFVFGYGGGGGSSGGSGGSSGGGGGGNGLMDILEVLIADSLEDFDKKQSEDQRRRQLERRQKHWEEAKDFAFEGAGKYDGALGTAADYGPAVISAVGWGVTTVATGGWGAAGKLALGAGMGAAAGGADALGNHLAGNEAKTLEKVGKGTFVGGFTSQLPPVVDKAVERGIDVSSANKAPKTRVYDSPESYAEQHQMQGPGMPGTPGTIKK
ncbi:MAG: hypothetical protein ACLFP9_09450 [Desulfonatronovibrio sp.]